MAITALTTMQAWELENVPAARPIESGILIVKQDGSRKEWFKPFSCYPKKVGTRRKGIIYLRLSLFSGSHILHKERQEQNCLNMMSDAGAQC